jgi:cation diffusion facilitator family transporter
MSRDSATTVGYSLLTSIAIAMNKTRKQTRLTTLVDYGVRATLLGVLVSAVLGAVKILAGVLGNSYALVADGIESMLDIISSLAVWRGLRLASSPPNERFPYGYGKAEPLALLAVATALFAASTGIAIQSVREILTPHHAPAPFTLFVLVGVVITKEILFRRLSKTGNDIGSQAVIADAWHHRADSVTSLAAFIGISVALIAGPGYESADDWAALAACVVIATNGYRLLRSGLREVIDAAPPPETEKQIRALSSQVAGVGQIEKCRVRKSGLVFFVEIHIVVDGDLPVRKGHDIAHHVEDVLLGSNLGIQDVTVHIEPSTD